MLFDSTNAKDSPPTSSRITTRWRDRIGSCFFWVYLGLSSAIIFVVAALTWAITRPFDPRLKLLHRLTCAWAYHYVQIVPQWRVKIRGREHLSASHAQILVANHSSATDILILFGIRRHFKWVSKAEMFRVPFLGWNMFLNRYVGIRRGSANAGELFLRQAGAHLQRGSSVLLFPEGTRSRDGQLLPFKSGFARLATTHDVEVVPIAIRGTRDILVKNGLTMSFAAHEIEVTILPPCPAPDSAENTADYCERVRATIQNALRSDVR